MNKPYRINVVVSYHRGSNVNQFRQPISDLLAGFAWLYHLEYAVSVNHGFGIHDSEADLIYFRSTDLSDISKKDLNALISNVFRSNSLIFHGVEVFCQMYKVLPQYPFPSVYYKPLNYPYVEIHNENKATLFLYQKALDMLDKEEHNKQLN